IPGLVPSPVVAQPPSATAITSKASFRIRLLPPPIVHAPPGALASHAREASRAGNDAGSERLDVCGDLAGTREPDAVPVLQDVLERAAKPVNPVRPPRDERMERDRAHEWLPAGLLEHLVELIHDHLRELVRRVAVPHDPARVVDLDGIRHGENAT